MKVYSLLVLLCFLQTLFCDKEGVNQESLLAAFNTSLPFIKSFHPSSFSLTGSPLIKDAKLYDTVIGPNNIQFRFDEFGLLHLKFVNLKGRIQGLVFIGKTYSPISFFNLFVCELSNINWEETYAIDSTKKAEGKYDVKFKSTSESSVSFNIFKLVLLTLTTKELLDDARFKVNQLSFDPFKAHLKKISGLILQTLQNRLK